MENLTDFENTEDVSDAAIEWVLRETGSVFLPEHIRRWAKIGEVPARARILAARLIQRYQPELLVDPVDAIVREELAKGWEESGFRGIGGNFRNGDYMYYAGLTDAAKRLYLLGIEKGEQS